LTDFLKKAATLSWKKVGKVHIRSVWFKSQQPHHNSQRPHSQTLLHAFSKQLDFDKIL